MSRIQFMVVAILTCATTTVAEETRLLRSPDISETHVAFVYANDIWVTRKGEDDSRRLTSFRGAEFNPHFSPDGKWIAFSGQYSGNTDVYLVPTAGGEPRRLTWHPGVDIVVGWSPDGSRIVFTSGRTNAPLPMPKMWQVPVSGGMPSPLPLPRVHDGKYSPDGKRLVYQMVSQWETEWRNYRGGQNKPIRIIDLQSLQVTELPWDGANDNTPVWVGDNIYFLSDRDFAMNVWSYSTADGSVRQRTFFKEFDCKSLEAGGGELIFENGAHLYSMNPSSNEPQKLSITVRGDFARALSRWESAGDLIHDRAMSPTGKRAVFGARGDIFTVPAKKGDVRNLTRSSGAADRAPSWSPDGKHISWFSDAGGEYQLIIADQLGENRRSIRLENPTFYYTPSWSPDSKYLSFGDADRNLWVVEAASGKATLVDNERFAHPERTIYPEWSPDSKWIAYTRRLQNEYNAIFVYSIDQKKSTRLTDGMSDSRAPAWDAGGKYLYFLASTNYALNVGWLDMSSLERPVRRAVYLAVLAADEPSPLEPESDDEEPKESGAADSAAKEASSGESDATPKVRIDFEGIGQRIVALDIPARNYANLQGGVEKTIFYAEAVENATGFTLQRYSLDEREGKSIGQGILDYTVSHDGKKLLYRTAGNAWGIADAAGETKPGEDKIATGAMMIQVDPAAEWKQIFTEAWRFQRDYFYVDNVHGLDLKWAYDTYSQWLPHVRHRADLTYVLDILGGETAIGHSFTGGGDQPEVNTPPVGLLGADLEIRDGFYRIAKIYTGENWNPELRSPLSGPGIDARVGDYILAVNGTPLRAPTNLFSMFDFTAGKQTRLTLGRTPDMAGARIVTVVPVQSETGLRQREWVESNRRRVDALSDGKLAYVWVPNTANAGFQSFNRYYFAQKHKKGAIIDERFNTGGYIADYIVDLLSRELLGYFNNPLGERQAFTAPNAAIWGPKVMLVNEMAGSGGDMLPYMFRMKKIGPLIGTRTWGGLVGIWDVPNLVDGGFITAPRGGFYDVNGKWAVENEGVAPDIEIEESPAMAAKGRDAQLEKAVEVALKLLKEREVTLLPQPEDPVRVKRPAQAGPASTQKR